LHPRATLYVGEHGIATAHLQVKLNDIEPTAKVLLGLLADCGSSLGGTPNLKEQPPDEEAETRSSSVHSVLGGSDLIFRLVTQDFRDAFHIQSRLIKVNALASTWIFSVPLSSHRKDDSGCRVGPDENGRTASAEPMSQAWNQYLGVSEQEVRNPSTSRGEMSYTCYLRLSRPVIQIAQNELHSYLVHRIQADARYVGIPVEVHFTLGWPDFALTGTIHSTQFHILKKWIVMIRHYLITDLNTQDKPRTTPVFQRSLTVVGPRDAAVPYQVGDGDVQADSTSMAALLIRARPGNLLRIWRILGQAFGHQPRCVVVDGKWDYVVFSDSGQSPRKAIHNLFRVKDELEHAGVQRLETHIFAEEDWQDHGGFPPDGLPLPLRPTGKIEKQCRCRAQGQQLQVLHDRVASVDGLPSALRITVLNCLVLAKYALHDESVCCELGGPLRALQAGLDRLLLMLNHGENGIRFPRDRTWPHFREWCKVLRRALRERSAASFEGLFRSSNSVSSYRGGLQKVLLIADMLLLEFLNRLPSKLAESLSHYGASCASAFTSNGVVHSKTYLGIIRIPLRFSFSLHLVLPQLWHEASQHAIQSLWVGSLGKRIRRTARAVEKRGLTEYVEQALEGKRAKWRPLNTDNFITDLLDACSDLLVFQFGFRENYELFCKYLTTFFLETTRYWKVGERKRRGYCRMLVMRLSFVTLYRRVLFEIRSGIARGEVDGISRIVDDAVADELRKIQFGTTSIVSAILEQVVHQDRYREWGWPRGLEDTALKDVVGTKVYGQVFVEALKHIAVCCSDEAEPREPPNIKTGYDSLNQGEILPGLGREDVAELYLEAYRRLLEGELAGLEPARAVPFQTSAALGMSALIAGSSALSLGDQD